MAFRYCNSCGNGLPEPTAAFDLNRHGFMRRCPHCGDDPGQFRTIEEWVIEIDERLRDLERDPS